MKIGQFNTRSQTRPMQLRSNRTNEPLEDDAGPCIVHIHGPETPQAAEAERAVMLISDADRESETKRRLNEDFQPLILARARHIIAGFDNIAHDDGHPLTLDDADWFLNLNRCNFDDFAPKSFGQQIVTFYQNWAAERGNV